MSEAFLRIAALEALEALTTSLSQLNAAIAAETPLVAWIQNTEHLLFPSAPTASAREKIQSILQQIHYLDMQDPREIILCAGFVGASEPTLDLARTVNEKKELFKQSMLTLKAERSGDILAKMGLARLHLKQCYRTIPILECTPHKISWTWANTRAIKKITATTAQTLLMKKGDDAGIQMQLQKLNQHPFHEPLAIVQELAPHLRANIVLETGKNPRRIMIKGALPIFFPCAPDTPYPQFTPPAAKKARDGNRPIRSDVKLDPTPFLPAIRAHRYNHL